MIALQSERQNHAPAREEVGVIGHRFEQHLERALPETPLAQREVRNSQTLAVSESGSMCEDGIVTPPWACGTLGSPVAKRMKKISYSGYRFPPEIIHQAIWLYLRFTLSLRDVEDLLAERGVALSYETVRRWVKSLRTDHRCRFAEASPEAAWDLAFGRGLSENRWPNGLPVASGRC